ncbi:hypothetical protein [Pseudodesulfovibrio indicus]|uniref:hypothetical protein n=1 Tax=Pseudodesulfovibrio indicus TaxID=1716143 RepID=UPI001063A724|nr:hypothetical protein [Pseudodesulfovibrio indicus]
MAILGRWRCIKDYEGKYFLTGYVSGHPRLGWGEIVTNEVNPAECKPGAKVISASGTEYELLEELPADQVPHYAVDIILDRAMSRLTKREIGTLHDEDLLKLRSLVEKMVCGELD